MIYLNFNSYKFNITAVFRSYLVLLEYPKKIHNTILMEVNLQTKCKLAPSTRGKAEKDE